MSQNISKSGALLLSNPGSSRRPPCACALCSQDCFCERAISARRYKWVYRHTAKPTFDPITALRVTSPDEISRSDPSISEWNLPIFYLVLLVLGARSLAGKSLPPERDAFTLWPRNWRKSVSTSKKSTRRRGNYTEGLEVSS
jgi:hypothetical protein